MDFTLLLDVAIGLTLVYLGASLFVTIINEYIAQMLHLRSKQLASNLKTLIDDQTIVASLKKSPALQPFFFGSPIHGSSYVQPDVLAQMLVGGLRTGQTGVAAMADVVSSLQALPDSNVKHQLLALSKTVKDDVEQFVTKVASWADDSLTMLGETYKKKTQIISFCVGLGIAILFNLDTIGVGNRLYRDKDARAATTAAAADLVQKTPPETVQKCIAMLDVDRRKDPMCAAVSMLADGVKQRSGEFGKLPIGWSVQEETVTPMFPRSVTRPLGWLLTALAISLGASFWFDLLNRLVNVRHGMSKPSETGQPSNGTPR